MKPPGTLHAGGARARAFSKAPLAVLCSPAAPAKVTSARHRKLMALQRRISHDANKALIGKEVEVLVEGQSDEHEYVVMGRHAGQAPEIDGQVYLSDGEALPGELRRVRIEQASDYDLVGVLLDEAPIVASRAKATRPRRKVALQVVR